MRTPRRGLRSRIGLGIFAVALCLGSPLAAAAQQAGTDQVVDRRLAYDAAKSQYDAALNARLVREKQWNDALEEHEQARRSGDAARQNAALIHALDLSRELSLADKRATDERRGLDAARVALLGALDERMEDVSGQVAAARTTADRARYAALLRDLDNQQKQLDADRDELKVQLIYYPSIQFDVRDTPEIMTGKAQLLRAKAQRQDSALAQIDREIERIDRQLRRSRNVQSLVTGVERFGDTQVPLGAANRRNPQGDVPARPDSAGVSRPEVTLQDQIQRLRLLRLQVQEAKRQFLERAAVFEQTARRIG